MAFARALGQTIGQHLTLTLIRQGLATNRSYRLTEGPAWLSFTNDLYARFQVILRDAFIDSANATQVTKGAPPVAEFSRFGPTNPRAIEYAQQYAAQLVRDLSATSQAAIREIITRMMNGELSVDSAARLIRATIGLTPQQSLALERFRQNLDQTLSEAQRDKLTEQRGRTMLASRAETIARTESMRAANEGQAAAWRDGRDRGFIPTGDAKKMWLTAADELVCPVCEPLDGQLTDLDSDWDGWSPPAHPNCRCSARLVYVQADGSFPTRRANVAA